MLIVSVLVICAQSVLCVQNVASDHNLSSMQLPTTIKILEMQKHIQLKVKYQYMSINSNSGKHWCLF